MSDKKVTRRKKDMPILNLIGQIKDGSLDPSKLPKKLRLQCVEVFLAQGYQVHTIAPIFKKCDKTIRRDIKDIFDNNKVLPDPSLVPIVIGEYIVNCRNQISSLIRLANNTEASVSERVYAAHSAFFINDGMLRRLQAVGYIQPETHHIKHKVEMEKPAVINIQPIPPKTKEGENNA